MTLDHPIHGQAVVRRPSDCETEEWTDSARGIVKWWTLVSGDRTPTSGLTAGLAEIPVGTPRQERGHWHEHAELYYVVSGSGVVVVDGIEIAVTVDTAVFIPGNVEHFAVNTGDVPLRLVYVFAADSFAEVDYCFPR